MDLLKRWKKKKQPVDDEETLRQIEIATNEFIEEDIKAKHKKNRNRSNSEKETDKNKRARVETMKPNN